MFVMCQFLDKQDNNKLCKFCTEPIGDHMKKSVKLVKSQWKNDKKSMGKFMKKSVGKFVEKLVENLWKNLWKIDDKIGGKLQG